ncbi:MULTISPECIES: hypothetical protein [Brachyspira]|uniref:hypothetical protein n=1 Tax=Brachyspira TaxID=29521 RepID=UPI0004838DBB|nr:hypothetical protein [Brachyspira alvinipulli]
MVINKTEIENEIYMKFYLADDEKVIDRLLEECGKKTYKEKYMFLYSLMGISEVCNYNDSENKIDEEKAEYEDCLAIFLEGTWRTI